MCSQVTSDRMRRNGLKLCQERFLHQKGCQALEQAAQGSAEVTIPGGILCVDVVLRDMIY